MPVSGKPRPDWHRRTSACDSDVSTMASWEDLACEARSSSFGQQPQYKPPGKGASTSYPKQSSSTPRVLNECNIADALIDEFIGKQNLRALITLAGGTQLTTRRRSSTASNQHL